MKVALCQFDIKWKDKEKNKKRILKLLDSHREKADWIIFPEMTLSGFSNNKTKTTLDRKDFEFFGDIAKKFKILVSFGGVENRQNKVFTLNKKGVLICAQPKVHLFSPSGEDKSYIPGDGSSVFKVKNFRVCTNVCYDLRFPYLFWNPAENTDIFVNIANWPANRNEHWITLLKARAIENQCYVIGVNRVGSDPTLKYIGHSLVIDPLGRVLLDAGTREGIFVCKTELFVKKARDLRRGFPVIKDRRPAVFPC
jgi:omega-amidase